MKPEHVLKIDAQRMEGASAADILEACVEAFGEEQGAAIFKGYAKTPMPDGRKRSEVNLGDPEEWA